MINNVIIHEIRPVRQDDFRGETGAYGTILRNYSALSINLASAQGRPYTDLLRFQGWKLAR